MHDDEWVKFDELFERQAENFDKGFKIGGVLLVVLLIMSMVLSGVIIWGLIELILHFT